MFRVYRFVKIANVTSRILTRHSSETSKILSLQHELITQPRFYSKNTDDKDDKVSDAKNKACKTTKKKPQKLVLKECKPVCIQPCKPPPPEITTKIPYLDECRKDDKPISQDCTPLKPDPEPECAYEEENKWDNYKNAVYLGLLLAAATLGALYAAGFFDKKEKCEVIKAVKKRKKKVCDIKDPKSSKDIPAEVPYLLIGGGTASFAAFRAIKSADPTAKVLVITDECFFPYMRPPLSKEMWFNDNEESVKKLIFKQWNGSERNLLYEPDDFYTKCRDLTSSDKGGVAVAKGWTVSWIDVEEKIAYLEDDTAIQYGKCLLATGSSPKNLAIFEVASSNAELAEKVKLFRNIYDFEDIYDTFNETDTVAVIGGGFLGSELACAMARKGKTMKALKHGKKKVYQIFRENGNMGKILPEYLSNWTTNKVKSEGVDVLSNTEVTGVQQDGDQITLSLSNGHTIHVDQAIVAVGVEPNTALAQKSGLEVDPQLGGYLVNTELMARSNLYIAGDCACFYDVKLGRRRIEHHDHAVVTGRLAGENMTGQSKPYLHQSMFWSDLGPDVGYEAIGIVDASLPTVGVFAKATDKDNPKAVVTATDDGIRSNTENSNKFSNSSSEDSKEKSGKGGHGESEDYGKGVIFYLRDDIVVGIVLWNVFNRMSVARQVLKDEKKYDDLNEVAKLFNIHED